VAHGEAVNHSSPADSVAQELLNNLIHHALTPSSGLLAVL